MNMNLRDLLVDLNKEFYGYKNDIFFTKFLKRTGSTCKVNTKSASIPPPPGLSFQIYYSSMGGGGITYVIIDPDLGVN